MTQNGFKLTLPDNTVFECTEQVDVTHQGETQFFVDGLSQVIGFWQNFIDGGGQDSKGDSNFQQVAVGVGAGLHTIEVQFTQYEGSSDTWGGLSTPLPVARTIQQELNRALTTARIDSTNIAELEVWQYDSEAGSHDPIPVVIQNWNLPHTSTQSEDKSAITGTLTFIESSDLFDDVDSQQRRTDR